MTAEHKTSCWMGEYIKGTDAQRAELKRTIVAALRTWQGNMVRTAQALGVSQATLLRYVARLGLDAVVDGVRPDRGKARRKGSAAGRRGGRPSGT